MKECNRTVLHVDDDPQILRVIGKVLENRGMSVVSIDDPMKAIEKLVQEEIRVVLLDIDMPNKNGLELLKEIKEYDGGVQVIMLTGLSTMSTVLQSLRWGAEACFFKPLKETQPVIDALESTFDKINRWWNTLEDLASRKRVEQPAATN